jgi:hypothetical protein
MCFNIEIPSTRQGLKEGELLCGHAVKPPKVKRELKTAPNYS